MSNTLTQVIDAKWFTQLKNGDDFLAAPADFSRNLVANIFENVKLVATIKTFTIVPIENFYITSDSLTQGSSAFTNDISVGDICRVVFNSDDSLIYRMEITAVSDTIIYYNVLEDTTGNVYPKSFITLSHIIVESDLTFLRYNHGLRSSLIPDEFYRSYLDERTLSYVCKDVGARTPTDLDPRGTGFVQGLKVAINGHSGSFQSRYIQNSQIPIDNVGSFNSAQEYEIEHIFTVQDYSEEDIQNYIDDTNPDNYLGEATLDYNSQFEFRVSETNPSTAKIDNYVSTGSVGFFGELLNGGPSIYLISNLTLTRVSTGASITGLASSEDTKITLTINALDNVFLSPPVIVINHFAMVTDYDQVNVEFDELFKNEGLRIEGVSTENGTYITEGKILSFTPTEIDIEFTVNPNDIDLEGLDYKLSVLVGNPDDTNEIPNKVNVPIQAGVYSDDFDIQGLIGPATIGLYTTDCDPYTDPAFTSMKMISGELINTKFQFLVASGTITNIQIQTITSKADLNQVVDTRTIDISGLENINGVQRISEVLPTPYNRGIDGSIDWLSGNIYRVVFPYRLPFDKLISVSGLADDLFDPTEPNNGQNESVYYQQTLGYTVHIAYLVTMLKDGKSTDYLFKTPTINVSDFETTL